MSMAILGIDFLQTLRLMVDPANCRLIQARGPILPAMAVISDPNASVITGDKLLPASSLLAFRASLDGG
jgi:hypothetical protein